MDLQELVERLLAQHRQALGRLHGEVQAAYDEAIAKHSDRFPDPKQMPGGALCGVVRAIVLDMNGLDALAGTRTPPRKPPKGASCGPESTLTMTSGPNSSVRLNDSSLTEIRVRKLPAVEMADFAEASPQPIPGPKPGAQMVLDEDFEEPILGPGGMGQQFDLFVFWRPAADKSGVAGAMLAAVADIDTSEMQILASTPLPPAIRPKSKAELLAAEQPDTDYEPADDFDEFDEDSGAETADPGA